MFESFKNVSVIELDEFVGKTTITDKIGENVQFIHYFIQKNACNNDVCNFLSNFLLNENLMEKTVIVNDAKHYKTVIKVTSTEVDEKMKMMLDEYEQYAECIFLHLQFDDENESTGYNRDIIQHRRKRYWKFYYQQKRKNIINTILDEYIQYKDLYLRTNNEEHIHKANNWIRTIRHI